MNTGIRYCSRDNKEAVGLNRHSTVFCWYARAGFLRPKRQRAWGRPSDILL